MYYFFCLGKFICLILPRDICYLLAKFLALGKFYLSHTERQNLKYNLFPVIEDKDNLDKYAKEVFINFAYYLVDFFRYSKLNEKFIKKYVRVSGLEILERALAEKKGVITVTAHIGNYELAGAVTSLLGYCVNAVALAHQDRRLNNFFNRQRKLVGIRIIPTNLSPKKSFSLLKAGQLVAFLGDRDFSGAALKADMFHRTALLPRGPAFFALKTGAQVIAAFLLREKKKFYHLIFEEPVFISQEAIKTEEEIVFRYADILSRYLKRYPGQWYMFEKYWLSEEVGSKIVYQNIRLSVGRISDQDIR